VAVAAPSPGAVARRRIALWLAPGAGLALLLVTVLLGFVVAITGASVGCPSAGTIDQATSGAPPSRSARAAIPRARLLIYQRAGRRFSIDWTFLASIGAQECNHDGCHGANASGCAGPMQIGIGGRCGDIWDQYKTDGNGDGRTNVNNPADAVFTAARLLRQAKHAPATGGSYADYRKAACNYYGACADAAANYADEVMARAVQYGFRGKGAPAPSDPALAQPATAAAVSGCGGGGAALAPAAARRTRKLFAPRHLAPLPAVAVASGAGGIRCDARIVADVAYLTRRYRVRVTACFAIHSLDGEHPLGAAVDLVPAGGDWSRTLTLARALGWHTSCAASGTAPACARSPFRFIGYNGFPNHGDPQHCVPCSGGAHLHLSWLTSASPGEPENAPRTHYFAPTWVQALSARTRGARG
jgi:hypothetical protein